MYRVNWKSLLAHYTELPSFFLPVQEVKAAILEDMVRLGKEAGLKSFEQVQHSIQ